MTTLPKSKAEKRTLNCPLCLGINEHFYNDEIRGWSYLKCRDCELVWKDAKHQLSEAEEKAHYSKHLNGPKDAEYRKFLSQLWEPLKVALQPGAKGLDYGSGPGPTLHLMAREDGFTCDHFDPLFHPDASVLKKKYDFITCSETAEHFQRPAEEFERLAGLLKQGGLLGIMTSMQTPEMDFANWHYRIDPTHVTFYSEATFRKVAELYNIELTDVFNQKVVLLKKKPTH